MALACSYTSVWQDENGQGCATASLKMLKLMIEIQPALLEHRISAILQMVWETMKHSYGPYVLHLRHDDSPDPVCYQRYYSLISTHIAALDCLGLMLSHTLSIVHLSRQNSCSNTEIYCIWHPLQIIFAFMQRYWLHCILLLNATSARPALWRVHQVLNANHACLMSCNTMTSMSFSAKAMNVWCRQHMMARMFVVVPCWLVLLKCWRLLSTRGVSRSTWQHLLMSCTLHAWVRWDLCCLTRLISIPAASAPTT